MPTPNAYDTVPYHTKPRRTAHPDAAATVARLNGLAPAPLDACRVLEIGCATGGNLLPMAATLPGSHFFGIDPSEVQIGLARAEAERFGIRNVRYEAVGIGALPADAGVFDYIICHGVYSWVPPPVQESILAACRRQLTPHGVAMISYNTYPGWHFRSIARDAMRYFTRHLSDPAEMVKHARGYIRFLYESVPDREHIIAKALESELKIVETSDDYYLLHEHFEDDHRPCYFHEFAARVGGHGLRYLGEAGPQWLLAGLSAPAQDILKRISRDEIELEQHVDMLRNRTFRHTLLVHAEAPVDREAPERVIGGMAVQVALDPSTPAPTGPLDAKHAYVSLDGLDMETESVVVNAILRDLMTVFPASLPVSDLVARVRPQVEEAVTEWEARVIRAVVDLYKAGFLLMQTFPIPFATAVSAWPRAWPLAAEYDPAEPYVPTLIHMMAKLTPLERFVLRQCDGTRDHAELTALVEAALAAGTFTTVTDATTATQVALQRLTAGAVLFS